MAVNWYTEEKADNEAISKRKNKMEKTMVAVLEEWV